MNSVDLKSVVESTIGSEWETFAQRHPMLAAAMDQDLLIEQCARAVREDPEYVEALRQVHTTGMQFSAVQDIVTQVARRLLQVI